MNRKLQIAVWLMAATVMTCTQGPSLAQQTPAGGSGVKLSLDGSTTVGPIADAFREYFKQKHGWDISVSKTGSGDGATAIIDGRCDIAMMSRFMKTSEFKKAVDKGVMPVAHVVAMDGVCVNVHPSNPVDNVTIDQLTKIYTGQITNWKQLGGPDIPIVAISRDSSSGTYEVFHAIATKKATFAESVEYVSSSPTMQDRIKSTPGAIGYNGMAFLDGVKVVKVEGVMPTRRTIAAGTYPIARPLFMFTNGYPKLGSPAYTFLTFHLTPEGQDIIQAKGFIPLTTY